MKICKIIIKDFQQFQDFELDMTYPVGHPKAGEPLEKVCLIGSNGTGKSTLLEVIRERITNPDSRPSSGFRQKYQNNTTITKFKLGNDFVYYIKTLYLSEWLNASVENIIGWEKRLLSGTPFPQSLPLDIEKHKLTIYSNDDRLLFKQNSNDLLVYAPAEGQNNGYNFERVPQVTVNDALGLFKDFPFYNLISPDTIKNFWKLLIYLIKKRENDLREFERKEENFDKTIRQVQEKFDKISPKILDEIAILWNKILSKAGLEFDVENANNPIQLNDNLQAYIKLKGTDKTLPYNELSTGIRNFIFRVGHIYALYFNRNIQRGFLLLDEPENSLYPDFLYDLIDIYSSIIKNTQFIVATHNPIIAAQFEPYERFLLEFDENGAVHAKRGVTPIGDDPNDLLRKDFGVRNVMGRQGVEKWERYVELKQLIPKEQNQEAKLKLVEEFMKIGADYNFSV